MKLPTLAECRKAAVAFVGLAGELAASGLLHGRAEAIVQGVVAAGTLAGIYGVRNAKPAPIEDDAEQVAAVMAALGR